MEFYATKRAMVRMLRAKGYDVPSQVNVSFRLDKKRSVYRSCWRDSHKTRHCAEYFASQEVGIRLTVDLESYPISEADIRAYGLYKKTRKPPQGRGNGSTGAGAGIKLHEDIIPQGPGKNKGESS